ncbi:MAG: hypothetical protein A2511_10600 [Deltaproteobacteria bacterium RIFOXYD12_FULL_50_9]|nr:MAG: hypothetical protein A2511_10600 [Deltaproteobacteria bacterium RIFOXYD12_FULL_50_9]
MKRIITALIAGGLWLVVLFSHSFTLFWLTLTLLTALALYEYFAMLCSNSHKEDIVYGVLFGIIPCLAVFYKTPESSAVGLLVSLLLLFGLIIFRYRSYNGQGFDTLCRYCFGNVFIGFFASHIVLIMSKPNGPYWLLLLTGITIASDSAAYYIGSNFGKTKLCPSISPGKTVAGLIGGIAGGAIAGVIIAYIFLPGSFLVTIGLISIGIATISMGSDLIESMIKRATGIKDSGHILPGHGGILDRIDSLLAVAPVFFYLIHYGVLSIP